MSGVLVGGEGCGAGGARRRQRAGLRTGASPRRGVCCRLGDTEGGGDTRQRMSAHAQTLTRVWRRVSVCPHLTV